MLRLLADENFNGHIVRGLRQHQPGLDLVRVQEVGLTQTADPDILAWAAAEGRVLLTHDRQTVPGSPYDRVNAGEPLPGVIVVDNDLPVGEAIAQLELLACCSLPDELRDRVVYVPL
jgi:hypothetical protein